jgi:hypothetical protein
MNAQDFRSLQEAYMEVVDQQLDELTRRRNFINQDWTTLITPEVKSRKAKDMNSWWWYFTPEYQKDFQKVK